ncbi:aspartate-semialdehyde dehydrogenase [bacterium]|nr:aspartate-semialdehyde dehydrogenase [bacterium]
MFTNLEKIQTVALVGATGLVGQEFLEILAEHKIKFNKLRLLASEDSAGDWLEVGEYSAPVEALGPSSFEGVDVAFFSVPVDVTRKFVPKAVDAGALVIDDSSAYRMIPDVPLIVPEVNGERLRGFRGKVIANPNCTVTPLALSLKPLQERYGLERVVVSTYQSVSGAGKRAYDELAHQTASLLNGGEEQPSVFAHPIAFNCLPLVGDVDEDGVAEEERKLEKELKKILELPNLAVSASAVRVPTFYGHGMTVNVQLTQDFNSIEEVRELLGAFPGIKVLDQPSGHIYPTNRESSGSDSTFVGRLRRDESIPSGLNYWVITDNLRKGAALNVLQCLDVLYKDR